MSDRLRQLAWWARQGLLTAGAVVGVACILVTLGAVLFGLRPLVFQSGSMSPTISTGDLAISREVGASALRTGDVVSVPTGTGTRVTHRIVAVDHQGSEAVLQLKGDANTTPDAATYRVRSADRVLFHLPRLGYVVGWMSGPLGLFLLGLYAAFLASVLVKRSPGSGPGGGRPGEPLSAEERVVPPSSGRRTTRSGDEQARMLVTGGLSVLLAAGALAGIGMQRSVTPTLAAWTDPAPVTGSRFTAYTVPPPPSGTSAAVCTVQQRGSGNDQGVVLTWPNTDPTVVYTATVTPASVVLSSPPTATTAGGSTTLTVTYSGPQSTKSTQATVTVTSSAPSAPTWSSAPVTVGKFTTAGQPSTPPTCG